MTIKQKSLCFLEWFVPRPAGPRPSPPRRFLLWSITHLGDLVLQLPAATALKRAHPTSRVTMVVKSAFRPLVELSPAVDEVICYDARWSTRAEEPRAGLAETLRLRRQLTGFDAAFIFDFHPLSRLLLRSTAMPVLVGYARRSSCLSLALPGPPADQHRLEEGLALLAASGTSVGAIDFSLQIPGAARERADELLRQQGWRGEPLVGICPGAGSGDRCWPTERFAAVANALAQRSKIWFVLLGTPFDGERARAVASAIRSPAINLVGVADVRERAALLTVCELVLTNNSGAMHLAAALGCTIVALFGPTDPAKWGPRGPGKHVVVCSATGKMEDLAVEQVLGAIAEHLPLGAEPSGRPAP